jgi:cytochrome bd-type quinol oxidase subunit 2
VAEEIQNRTFDKTMAIITVTLIMQVVVGGFFFLLMYSKYNEKPFNFKLALQHQILIFIVLFIICLFSSGDDSNTEWVETPNGGQWVEMK